jgi:hypothetical protein
LGIIFGLILENYFRNYFGKEFWELNLGCGEQFWGTGISLREQISGIILGSNFI